MQRGVVDAQEVIEEADAHRPIAGEDGVNRHLPHRLPDSP
jgi:hypothetical protein